LIYQGTDESSLSTLGTYSVLTLLVNFSDRAVTCSRGKVENILSEKSKSTSNWFSTTSYGTELFQFDTNSEGSNDTLSVSIAAKANDTCDNQAWADLADAAALDVGVNVDNFTHVIYILPPNLTCPWGGLAEFDCANDCRAWIAICDNKSIYTHELGHNLGVDHASTDLDNDGVIDDEYGDTSCPMGTASAGFRHFNVPHKFTLGWLPGELATGISADGFVTVAAAEQALADDSSSIRAVRVFVNPAQPALGRYYFSFRAALDDFSSALKSPYLNKLNVHLSRDLVGKTSYLSSLGVDQSWTDERGRRVTLSDFDGAAATVWVSPTGTEQPKFAVSGVVAEKNGKSIPEGNFAKFRVQFTKLSSKEKTTVVPESDGSFSALLTYGNYKVQLKKKGKKVPYAVSTKPFTRLVSEDATIALQVKKSKKK
ncbi:MAG: hypothetical protein KDD70_15565, partial [Bdellovibrionales bacterium]|nr:hypothetical protein [Bdellovibrionales bacterium]